MKTIADTVVEITTAMIALSDHQKDDARLGAAFSVMLTQVLEDDREEIVASMLNEAMRAERVERSKPAGVTRFEVIDHRSGKLNGRAFVSHDVIIDLVYQDDGRTLKVFVVDNDSAVDQSAGDSDDAPEGGDNGSN